MLKITIGVLVAAVALLMVPAAKQLKLTEATPKATLESSVSSTALTAVPAIQNQLDSPSTQITNLNTVSIVNLELKNTVVLRGPVTGDSVGKVIQQIRTMRQQIGDKESIYLVLDTPGGSVFDGLDLIDYLDSIPNKVKTVTLFAASMGFQIVQANKGERLISRNGTLMSHRATLGGLGGQLDGEFESRYRMIKRKVDFLDVTASNRMGIALDVYKQSIVNELWVHGFDAEQEKVADKMVLVSCGDSLVGTDSLVFNTFFGPVTVNFDKCPLIKEPISIDFGKVRQDAQPYVKNVFQKAIHDKQTFIKQFISTDKFYKVFN